MSFSFVSRRVVATLVATSLLASLGVVVASPAVSSESEGDYVVILKSSANVTEAVSRYSGKKSRVKQSWNQSIKGLVLDPTPRQLRELRADPEVLAVAENSRVSISGSQSSPSNWGLDRIDQYALPLGGSFEYDATGKGVRAYVVDTGVASYHAEFSKRMLKGISFVYDGWETEDCEGHGTHVAGILGGTNYGVAKGVSIVPVRVLDCYGGGYLSDVIDGLAWIASTHKSTHRAVVNMSLGSETPGQNSVLTAAVNQLVSRGITVVVAAGNNYQKNACEYSPSGIPAAITVGASGEDDVFADYSNAGPCVDIVAPGSEIYSAAPWSATAADTYSGTSMAAPHVAGAVALLLEKDRLTPAAVDQRLKSTAAEVITGAPEQTTNLMLQTLPPTMTPAVVRTEAVVGIAFESAPFVVRGLVPALTEFEIVSGGLPDYLSFDPASGVISGVPEQTLQTSFTVSATDGYRTTQGQIELRVDGPPAAPTNLVATAAKSGSATVRWTAVLPNSGVSRSAKNSKASNISQSNILVQLKQSDESFSTVRPVFQKGSGTSVSITKLTAPGVYRFVVSLTNRFGTSVLSEPSNEVNVTVTPPRSRR